VVENDLSRQVDWMLRANCMAYAVTGGNSDGYMKEYMII
jgi:hypothetical protein